MGPLVSERSSASSAPESLLTWAEDLFLFPAFAAVASLFDTLDHLLVQLPLSLLSLAYKFLEFGKRHAPQSMVMVVDSTATAVDPQADFEGDITVNNKPPSKSDLEKVAHLPVLDANKKSRTFKSLYADNEHGSRRVLILFIRHFFCGNCQEYLRTFASSVTPSILKNLTPPTEIVIIGCGQPDLIPMYIRETSCPYPVYADPTRQLYHKLGMTMTLALGAEKPQYMQRSMLSVMLQSIIQEFRSGRRMLSGGDFRQVGGEFIFENGKVTFCHRMKNTRDHAEIPVVRKELGLDGQRPPARKRWSTNSLGTGLGRRFIERRSSWGASRSRSRNTDKGSEVHMSGVQEEADALPEDALKKLEGKTDGQTGNANGAEGTVEGRFEEETKGSSEVLGNETPSVHVTA